MYIKNLIVGAGLAGATMARRLADHGEKSVVIEKHNHVAGHCYDYRNEHGITVHKYGPHIFHTKNKLVWDFVTRFSEFSQYQHRVLSYAEGQYWQFPVNLNTLRQLTGDLSMTPEDARSFIKSESMKYRSQLALSKNPEPASFTEAVLSQVGRRLYDLFYAGYTRKQWQRDPDTLSAALAKRIPVYFNADPRYFTDPYQGLPVDGYTALVQKLLDHPNISVWLNTDFFELKDQLTYGKLIYTGPLDQFFAYSHDRLEYRSLRLETKTVRNAGFELPAPVVNYPNDYDWTRVTELKQLSGEKSDYTTLLYEYATPEGEPFYIVPDQKNDERRQLYLKAMTSQPDVTFIGRLAEYKYYNMDEVIHRALTVDLY